MRPGHSTSRSNQADGLASLNSIAYCNERPAHVEVRGDDSIAVVNVDDIAREKEIVDESNDSAVGCNDWISGPTSKVDTEVPARQGAVEHASRAEPARYY